ncbi:MAG: PDZ domain-containing protein [Pirellula sp.]
MKVRTVTFSTWLLACCLAPSTTLMARDVGDDEIPRDTAIAQLQDLIDTLCDNHANRLKRAIVVRHVVNAIIADSSVVNHDSDSIPQAHPDDFDDLKQALRSVSNLRLHDAFPGDYMQTMHHLVSKKFPGVGNLIPAREATVAKQLLGNQYVGIGIQIGFDDKLERAVLNRVFEKGSGYQAGIRDKDTIVSVDGNDTHAKPIEEVVQWLRGPAGTQVKLEIRRPGEDATIKFIVPRRVVPLPTVEIVPQNVDASIAIVQFLRISPSCEQELRNIEAMLEPSVRAIVLDFRFVREDGLHFVHLLLDALLDAKSIGLVETKTGKRPIETEAGRLFSGRQLAVVVSPNTTSCTQWASLRLQEHGTKLLVDDLTSPHLIPYPTRGDRLPNSFRWTKAFALELVPIKNEHGSIWIPTAKLLDRDSRQSMVLTNDQVEEHTAKDQTLKYSSLEKLLGAFKNSKTATGQNE